MSYKKFIIALIEDDENHIFLIKKAIQEFRSIFEVDTFHTAHEFLSNIEKKTDKIYDACIIDYSLPKMNGLELLKKLNDLTYNAPAVFVTNYEDRKIIQEALSAGAYDYILKKEGFLSVLPLILLKIIDKHRVQKQKQEYLKNVKNLKEYFEYVINTIPSCIIGLTNEYKISYANLECQKLFFMDPSNLIDKEIIDIFAPDFIETHKIMEKVEGIKNNNDSITLTQVKFKNIKNEEKIIDIQIFKISTALNVDILFFIKDITRNIELEQKLSQTEKLASFGKLLTGITHELNNRISPVLAYSQLLLSQSTNRRHKDWLSKIENSAKSVKSIVESLLYFSGTAKQHNEDININKIIDNTLSLFRYKFKSSNIHIEKNLKKDIPPLKADKNQINKVILNIISNSLEAMDDYHGGTLYISTNEFDDLCEIVIKDTGIGIPEKNLNKIFDPFFTTKTDQHNVGLGLSTVYNIVQNYKGTITVSSTQNEGTQLTITLPIIAQKTAEFIHKKPIRDKSLKVLIIDDDPILRDVMKDILEEICKVDIAENGKDAIEKIKISNYNAILTDIRMPNIDGPSLYRWIKKNHPGLEQKIVFTTGDTYDPKTNEFLNSINNNYISKPFYINKLKDIIKKVLI
ncbi:response regulator [bacterium]|nr:response regulator [bacterium]